MTLVNETIAAGNYEVEFNGSNLSSGVYFYRIESGEFISIKKMILIR
ncbi:MAG TPA: T9SS type A sorting domain-containing protein [Ignavibacteria bacterium]|nr:T9SS type A sorting domain-containing protein [Ignavibacteria bacterium]